MDVAAAILIAVSVLLPAALVGAVRVGAETEEGLDASMHGESAYALGV